MILKFLKKMVWSILILEVVSLPPHSALAAGTSAGTNISNQAQVTYSLEGVSLTQHSNVATVRVDELINVNVIWQDSSAVPVKAGNTGRVLTFRVTNTGNGTEAFTLSGNSSLGGDEFDPALEKLYLDANGNGLYDAGDVPYVPAGNDPVLPADGSTTVFVLNSIPGSTSANDRGNSQLTAAAKTGTGVPGAAFPGAGDGGTDAVMGTSGGRSAATGTYLVSASGVSILKTAMIADPSGGTSAVTGAVITYSLTVTVSGSETAQGVIITDAVPANTTYRGGTLTLNSGSLTDAGDGDAGDVGVTTPGVVTVALGNLTAASPAQIITFRVIIN